MLVTNRSWSGKLQIFPTTPRGPTERRTIEEVRQIIVALRKENLSSKNIQAELIKKEYSISVKTVERILAESGFSKLSRRTALERGATLKNQVIQKRSSGLNFSNLQPFRYDCPTVGVFFFLPYLIESGILEIVSQASLPESSDITAQQACLSMLLLKLIGSERLGHIQAYDHEPGFGLFAGLNFLPKSSFMSAYSCRTSEDMLADFQSKLIKKFKDIYPDFYRGDFINLDFHSIPHFGEQSQMEKVWCGARGKAIKGANTLFAQDSQSNVILYTRADILRRDEAGEIKKFVEYWKKIRGSINETLVFDCRLTTYSVLGDLDNEGVKFITLRKRNKNLLEFTSQILESGWKTHYLPIPKRKHKSCKIHESEVEIDGCNNPVRQLIVTGNGRAQPTYIITNNRELSTKEVLLVYARRWHIENKFSELVSFFNLNALSSPLMIRIHFDILWTIIADTLYHRFARDLPRFEHERANSLFRNFVNIPGQIIFDGEDFTIKIRKRAHTPILLGNKRLTEGFRIPWLQNRLVKIVWTA